MEKWLCTFGTAHEYLNRGSSQLSESVEYAMSACVTVESLFGARFRIHAVFGLQTQVTWSTSAFALPNLAPEGPNAVYLVPRQFWIST